MVIVSHAECTLLRILRELCPWTRALRWGRLLDTGGLDTYYSTGPFQNRGRACSSLQVHDFQRLRESDLNLKASLLQNVQHFRRRLNQRCFPGMLFEVIKFPEVQRVILRQLCQWPVTPYRVMGVFESVRGNQHRTFIRMLAIVLSLQVNNRVRKQEESLAITPQNIFPLQKLCGCGLLWHIN